MNRKSFPSIEGTGMNDLNVVGAPVVEQHQARVSSSSTMIVIDRWGGSVRSSSVVGSPARAVRFCLI